MTCHRCGSDQHLIRDCPVQSQTAGHHHTDGDGPQQTYVGSMHTPRTGLLAGVQLPSAQVSHPGGPAGIFMTTESSDKQEELDNHHWSAISIHDDDNPWTTYSIWQNKGTMRT
eukprot:7652184-Pyramimonas_sp.AAC.1